MPPRRARRTIIDRGGRGGRGGNLNKRIFGKIVIQLLFSSASSAPSAVQNSVSSRFKLRALPRFKIFASSAVKNRPFTSLLPRPESCVVSNMLIRRASDRAANTRGTYGRATQEQPTAESKSEPSHE